MPVKIKIHKIPTPYVVGPVDIFELETGGKKILVDTGPQTKEATEYLKKNIDLKNLDYLLVTHCHPDHYGLARYIEEQSKATLVFCKNDALLFELFEERMDFLYEALLGLGFPLKLMDFYKGLLPRFQGDVPFVNSHATLEDVSQVLEKLGITWFGCPGHSQSDIVFKFDDKAITGDCLLRDIFPAPLLDMDVNFGGRFKNYQAFCESIPKLMSLKDRTIIPSHNDYIESVESQLVYLHNKIKSRSKRIAPLVKKGLNGYEILNELFPNLDKQHFKLYIKASELCFFEDYVKEPELLENQLRAFGIEV
ncbi:MAG: MBL fold metallo-hydrolase [SAR324 cluster bacterium]|nr:MBL fold metallo-hydrolase [SAR324 cluster bacterium]